MPVRPRPEDRFPDKGRSCGRSSRVRVSGCEPEDPGANPGGHPIECARCRSSRGGGLQTRSYPVRMHCAAARFYKRGALSACRRSGNPGRASISGPSSNSKTTQRHCVDRGATPRGSTNPTPPKRRKRRTSSVTMRDRCKSDWRILLPCSSTARAPGSDPGG